MDIGASTSAHSVAHNQQDRNIERLLLNWGNWQASIPEPSSSGFGLQPMFKEFVAGYRDTKAARVCIHPDEAEKLDPILAQLSERDIMCLYCYFALELSSRNSAAVLSKIESKRSSGYRRGDGCLKCNHATYLNWTAVAINNAETIIMFAQGVYFD